MTQSQPTRLWEKGVALDPTVHRFTVGDDPIWDQHLVHWDCLGSAAHARTLEQAVLLTSAELDSLLAGLREIDALARAGHFEIPPELEDCHTAIEAHLTRRCGDAGAKIHAGRSRNDQSATALRLFMRHHALVWLELLDHFAAAAAERAQRDGDVAMPGYTHMQPAMPSSVGQWLHAQAEAALEQMHAVLDLLGRLDACPLGTGAGFGVPLPLDRARTAAWLGFTKPVRNPIDAQNGRGRMEKYFVRVAADTGTMLEKLSCDMLLYTSAEYGFFALPDSLTTGSSIMPQKKNPDLLELLRAHGARLRGRLAEVEWVTAKLPSGYHRDLQLSKEPALRAAFEAADMLRIATRIIAEFKINERRLTAAMRPELYAASAALDRVRQGTPFRAAYRQVAEELAAERFDARAAAERHGDCGRVAAAVWAELNVERRAACERAADFRQRAARAEESLNPEAP